MRLVGVVVLLIASRAFASGIALEVGGGYAGRSAAVDVAIEGRFSLESGSSLELRGRTFFEPAATYLNFGGAAVGVRYRSPSFGSTAAFSLAGGGGIIAWLGCIVGDACFGLVPFVEVNPTLELRISEAFQPFIAANFGLGYVVFVNPTVWFSAGASIGVMWDFARQPRPSPWPTEN